MHTICRKRSIIRKSPKGFSLLETLVALAIAALIGSIAIGSVSGYLDQQRVRETSATLKAINLAIGQFRSAIADYPGRLSHLSRKVSTADFTACNQLNPVRIAYPVAAAANWLTNGPFWDRSIPTTGLVLPIGTARDSMTRTSNNTTAGFLNITVPEVDVTDARMLNSLMDGANDADQVGGNNNTGSVQYSVLSGTAVTLTYWIPVANSC